MPRSSSLGQGRGRGRVQGSGGGAPSRPPRGNVPPRHSRHQVTCEEGTSGMGRLRSESERVMKLSLTNCIIFDLLDNDY